MNKEELIKKWLNDDLNATDREAFEALDDSVFNEKIVEDAKRFSASNFSKVDDFDTFKKRYDQENSKVKSINWFRPLSRIAAVIVIALGLYFTLFNDQSITIETLASEKTTIELPDQSTVQLNASSSLTYDEKDFIDERQLNLDGEAYFIVAKGKTFDVLTSDGIVTVVGTQFNVKQRENYFEVQCYEGIVKVSSNNIERRLTAGQTYKILNGNFTEGEISFDQPQWTLNKSLFNNIPFTEVVAEMERQYDVEISVNASNVERLFTGGFTHDDLEEALKSVTIPMNLTYTMSSSKRIQIHE